MFTHNIAVTMKYYVAFYVKQSGKIPLTAKLSLALVFKFLPKTRS